MSLRDKITLGKPDPLGLITPERLEELRREARVKVQAKLLKKQEDDFLSGEVKRLEREVDPKPEYEIRSIVIECADHTDCIRIDNQYFYYGQRYDVAKPVYDQLVDIIARGWRHEEEISIPTRRIMSNNRGVVLHGESQGSGARF